MAIYEKYVYWLQEETFADLKETLEKSGCHLHKAKKAVCVPLSRKMDMGYVPPDSWEKDSLCKRQLSWYRTSAYVGQILLISSRNLAPWGLKAATLIRDSSFRCRKFPSREEQLTLLDRESYQSSKPDAWDRIDEQEKDRNERWLKVMGIHGKSYEELFITHCANHANFIEPEYFLEDGERIPYSLGKTTHICSACLEFFNIIGSKWRKKLVAPCPGAVLFAGLSPNRYYEVVQPD